MSLQTQIVDNHVQADWIHSILDKTISYVRANVVRSEDGRKCVDGRYLPYQATGMIARPGGDSGYVMALLAVSRKKNLGLSPEQCFNAVYKAVAKGNGRFCMHTDHHADPDTHTHHGLIGCGHLAKAASKHLADAYDVDSGDVERIIHYARNVAEISPALEMVNLSGEHKEVGVLVIHSRSYTINAENPLMGQMYFIYDEERDIEFMKKLVTLMEIDGVNFAVLKKESDLQLQATLHNLAKGLPLYTVTFTGSNPKVHFSHFIA